MRVLWIFRASISLFAGNDSKIDDHDKSPGQLEHQDESGARLIRESVNKLD